MSDFSDSSLRGEDNDDIVAEYENLDSDNEKHNFSGEEGDDDQGRDTQMIAPRRIDPKTSRKRVTLNPLPKLDTQLLKGPKGIHTIEKYFEGFKYHGKGHEKTDLDRVMKRLEHWSHRLFPKLHFDDFLEKMEQLGAKKDLQTFIKKYRMDLITTDISVPTELLDDGSDKEESTPVDEFDMLIAEQIEKQKQVMHNNSAFDDLLNATTNNTPNVTIISQTSSTFSQEHSDSSSKAATTSELSAEIKAKIEKNRQQAIQRRLARIEAMKEEAKRVKLKESENAHVPDNPDNSSHSIRKLNDEQSLIPIIKHDNTAETNIKNNGDESLL